MFLPEARTPASAVYQAAIAVRMPSHPPICPHPLPPPNSAMASARKVRNNSKNTDMRARLVLNVPRNIMPVKIAQPRRKNPRAVWRSAAWVYAARMPRLGIKMVPKASQKPP